MAKALGALLVIAGIIAVLFFAKQIAGDDEFAKVQLLADRNPGNVMYEAKLGGKKIERGFRVVGAIAGGLLALNGTTLLLLGVVAGRRQS